MYPVSAAYKTAIAQNVRNTKISGTITLIDDTIINITDEDIALGSLYLTEQCVAGEDIEIGNVYASELGFTLKSPPENPYSLDGARVLINFGIDVGGGVFEYVPLGYFYVTEIERKHTAVNLKALDGMILFDTDLTGVLTGGKPRTIISSCCAKVGITLATDTATFNTFANANVDFALPQGSKVKTCRDLIMWVCQALGCFARMNREGQLEIVPIRAGTSVKTISKPQRFSSDVSDFTVKITKVAMTVGGTEYAQGVDGMTMALEENPLLLNKQGAEINIILANILNQVTQAEYTPYNVKFAGDPAIQAGDWITIPDTSVLGGGDVVSLVTHSTWRYRGPHEIRAAGKGAFLRGMTQTQQTKAVSSVVAIATAARALAQAANQSTQLIKDAIGGHVLIRREPGGTNEILIMDHPDPEQAVKIWRWNMGGLGYSDNVVGADNPDREYTIAMTMDGAINADFVRTGEINTNLVKILGNSNFYWDGDYLYIVNPADGNQQIRLSKEGIRFTRDGGQTWRVAMDFDGIRMEGQSQDGYTHYVGDGVKVYDEQGNLVGHLGSFEVPSGQTATFSRASVAYKQNGQRVAAGQPRFEPGKFGQAVMVEEGTTNIFSAEDSSFEGGTIGNWTTILANAVIITGGWHGAKAVQVTATALNGRIRQRIDGTLVNLNDTVTLSAYAKLPNGAAPMDVTLSITIIGVGYRSVTKQITSDKWTRLSVTTTLDTLGSGVYAQLFAGRLNSDTYGTVIWDAIQLEKKPYATSFIDGTRSPEVLTIPGKVMPDNEGTITLWAKKNDVQAARARKILDAESPRIDWQWNVSGGYSVNFGGANLVIPDPAEDVEWHFYAITYSGRTVNLYFDGVKVGTGTATVDLVSFSDLTLGSRFNGTNQADALIDDLRISSRSRTDQEILAAYQSGQPLPVDERTTWKSSFDGHLRNEVPVREYGLWVGKGKIQGTVMRGNEIYSSSFSTCNPGETKAYAEINTEGDIRIYDPFGKLGMLIFGGWGQGTIKWYLDGIEYATANIDAGSYQDLWIRTRRSDSGIRLETYEGQYIEIGSGGNSSIEVKAGTSGTVYVYSTMVVDDFYVTGTKDAVQKTENYGYRSLTARESPEAKYVDEGKACLVNGECRIELDPIFLECIEPNTSETPWLFHLTPLAPLNLYVAEIGETYFVVKDVNNALEGEFCWAVSGIRKGYAGRRFIEHKLEDIKPKQNET